MSDCVRLAEPVGVLQLADIGWHLRVYLMRGDRSEGIQQESLFAELAAKVREIESSCLSAEFSYIRSGFIIAHYGRRGVTYTVWHWADWNGTWECFSQAWYCYQRRITSMEPLDRNEPAFCHHELKVVATEGRVFLRICNECGSLEEIVKRYRSARFEDQPVTE